MLRALAKGALLWAAGNCPGGARAYRNLTRDRLGTQATHVDKLARVWPGYAEVWQSRCGLRLDGLDIWVHEAGWTPFAAFADFLVTGSGGVLTNSQARVLDRYLSRAVNGALACALPTDCVPDDRRRKLEALRWHGSAAEAVAAVGGRAVELDDPTRIPLESGSMDLCHSGGALEHYRPEPLEGFIAECFRVLRPGGVASHVFDHRDHLYHADKRYPFMAHLALADAPYRLLCGHALLYHNRLMPAEVACLFERAGFERVAVRRMILPDQRYVEGDDAMAGEPGLRRRSLAHRFRTASEIDLRTAAAHYIYRKPGGSAGFSPSR